jgi:hypothetical protein
MRLGAKAVGAGNVKKALEILARNAIGIDRFSREPGKAGRNRHPAVARLDTLAKADPCGAQRLFVTPWQQGPGAGNRLAHQRANVGPAALAEAVCGRSCRSEARAELAWVGRLSRGSLRTRAQVFSAEIMSCF